MAGVANIGLEFDAMRYALASDYVVATNVRAAQQLLHELHAEGPATSCPELSPPGRRLPSGKHLQEDTPPDRGASRAVNRPTTTNNSGKSRGGRSRRR